MVSVSAAALKACPSIKTLQTLGSHTCASSSLTYASRSAMRRARTLSSPPPPCRLASAAMNAPRPVAPDLLFSIIATTNQFMRDIEC